MKIFNKLSRVLLFFGGLFGCERFVLKFFVYNIVFVRVDVVLNSDESLWDYCDFIIEGGW